MTKMAKISKVYPNIFVTVVFLCLSHFNGQAQLVGGSQEASSKISRLLNTLLVDYDPRLRPNFLGSPSKINIGLQVKGIEINEEKMELTLDLYMRQSWTDDRLKYNLSYPMSTQELKKIHVLALTEDFIDKIWTPDTFFRNEKNSFVHKSVSSNRFFRLYSEGNVQTSTRVTVTAICQMDFSFYPMDKQVCGLDLGSYGYTTDDLIYTWCGSNENNTIEDDDGGCIKVDISSVTLGQMKVKGHRKGREVTLTSTGEYSALFFKLLFVRSLKYFLVQTYLPSIVVVIVSYFALWMSRDGASNLGGARIGLGITSVLTMVTIYMSSNSNLAHTNTLKALDIYLGVCFLFVFSTLLQSCFVIYFHASWAKTRLQQFTQMQKSQDKKKDHHRTKKVETLGAPEKRRNENNEENRSTIRKTRVKNVDTETDDNNNSDLSMKPKHSQRGPPWVSKFDLCCRAIFPAVFIAFNVIYWTYFLSASRGWRSSEMVKQDNWVSFRQFIKTN